MGASGKAEPCWTGEAVLKRRVAMNGWQ